MHLPAPTGTARLLGSLSSVGLLGGLGIAFWRREGDWEIAGQASAVALCMLLIPVYTYEHHLVWAIPAAVLVGLATFSGRLPAVLVGIGALSVAVLCFDLQALKVLWTSSQGYPWLAAGVQELKMLALLGLLAPSVWIGRGSRGAMKR